MKIENQVCTLEQAKRLHELGVEKHKSLFSYWPNPRVLKGGVVEHDGTYVIMPTGLKRTYGSAVKDSAFSVDELIQILGSVKIDYDAGRWYVRAEIAPSAIHLPWCLATLLIHRLENNLTTADEVNKRLQQ